MMGVCVGQLYESRCGRIWEIVAEDTRGRWVLQRRDRRLTRTTRELRQGYLWRLITPTVGKDTP